MMYLDLVMAYVYLRLNRKQYQQMVIHQQNQSRFTGNQSASNISGRNSLNFTRNTNNVGIVQKLQNQDYFLKEAMKHFVQFKVRDMQKSSDKIMLMMFMHVQNQLVR